MDAHARGEAAGFAAPWLLRLAWGAILALSALILVNTLPYLSFRENFAFIAEKGGLGADAWWRCCFYTHISGGLVCLVSGPFLIWPGLLRRCRALHRWLGRAYALTVLGWAGPAGLYLSFHAKGGLAGRSCFLLLTLLWWGATARGLRAILARRVPEHTRWMRRSYALALSAVFFRIFQVAIFFTGMDDATNYALSLWLSLAASLVVGEALVRRSRSIHESSHLKGALS